jgi:hypothetical protein
MINRIKNKYRRQKNIWMYNGFFWRLIMNGRNSFRYMFNKPKLNEAQQKILQTLRRDGIAVFRFEDLYGSDELFKDLCAFYDGYQESHKEILIEERKNAGLPGAKKSFIHTLREEYTSLDYNNPMVKIGLHKNLGDIASEYYGMKAEFRYFDLWHTFVSKGEPMRSQNWHRDPEDYLLFKAFIYLNDVDESAGPFIYAKGSHALGQYTEDPEWYQEDGHKANRSGDDAVASVIPKDKWFTATGTKGTMIIADTRGVHRGGYASEKERIVYNCMYVSPSSYFGRTFDLPPLDSVPNEEYRKSLYANQ